MRKGGLLTASLLMVLLLSYCLVVIAGKTDKALLDDPALVRAYDLLALPEVNWQSFAILETRDAPLPLSRIWPVFAAPARWSDWGESWFTAARWVEAKDDWKIGCGLDLTLDLGPPFGQVTGTGTVVVADVTGDGPRTVAWVREAGGVRQVHVWRFEPLPGGGTRIRNGAVFAGLPAAMIRPLVEEMWRIKFRSSLSGLIDAARKVGTGA